MSALVCEKPTQTDVCPRCGDLAELVQTLREEVGQLRREVATLRAEAGYWKSRHADAVKRNGQLQAELQQARGEIRQLKAKLLAGRPSVAWLDKTWQSLSRTRDGRHRGSEAGSRATAAIDVSTTPICRRWKKFAR